MKKKKGTFLIRTGLLLIAAAFALCGYNVYDGYRAGTASLGPMNHVEAQIMEAMQSLYGYISPSPETIHGSGELPYPGMQPSVAMDIPTETVVTNAAEPNRQSESITADAQVETVPTDFSDVMQGQMNPDMQSSSGANAPEGGTVQGSSSQMQTPIIPGMQTPDGHDEIGMDSIVADTRKETVIPDYVLNPKMEMPVSRYDGEDYIGILEIPAINLKIPVISQWSYPGLKIAPCRYTGSAYTNDLVISAHNYTSHFGNLKRLSAGAAVRFTDMDGNVFNYRVALKETIDPYDIEYMTDSGWDLSLFTCTVGGSYRVTVRCSLVRT